VNDPIPHVSNFSTLDWEIVAVYLSGTVAVGLLANRYIKDMADYVVAGRSLKSYISVATMLGSEIGLVMVMYTAERVYRRAGRLSHRPGGWRDLFSGRRDRLHRCAFTKSRGDDDSRVLWAAVRIWRAGSRRPLALGGAQRRSHDDDLHPRLEPRRTGRP